MTHDEYITKLRAQIETYSNLRASNHHLQVAAARHGLLEDARRLHVESIRLSETYRALHDALDRALKVKRDLGA